MGDAGDGAGVDGVQVGQGVDRPSVNTKTDEYENRPLAQFFSVSFFCKKSSIFLEGKSMILLQKRKQKKIELVARPGSGPILAEFRREKVEVPEVVLVGLGIVVDYVWSH